AEVVEAPIVRAARVTPDAYDAARGREAAELERRVRRYHGDARAMDLAGKTVLVVDDGVATGATERVACRAVRDRGASRVVVAVPVGAADALAELHESADEVVALSCVRGSFAVGEWFDDFAQTGDDEVIAVIARAAARPLDGA
ncbi:MAG: phosphoribosyltransferase family protein, partial [Acidimicrobiales bacterium]